MIEKYIFEATKDLKPTLFQKYLFYQDRF